MKRPIKEGARKLDPDEWRKGEEQVERGDHQLVSKTFKILLLSGTCVFQVFYDKVSQINWLILRFNDEKRDSLHSLYELEAKAAK